MKESEVKVSEVKVSEVKVSEVKVSEVKEIVMEGNEKSERLARGRMAAWVAVLGFLLLMAGLLFAPAGHSEVNRESAFRPLPGPRQLESDPIVLPPPRVIAVDNGQRVSQATVPKEKKILRVAENVMPRVANPLRVSSMEEFRVLELIHDGPFKLGETGEPEASLIETGQTDRQPRCESTDSVHVEGWLSKAFFHDGSPVTVADLKLSFDAYAAAVESYRASEFYRGLVKEIKPADPDNSRHFKLTLGKPLQNVRYALSLKILPRSGFLSLDPTKMAVDTKFAKTPIGAGPFKAKNVTDRARWVLEAHKAYHGGAPKLDEIEIIGFPTSQEKLLALKSNQVNVIVSLTRDEQKTAMAYGAHTLAYPLRNWWYLAYNMKHAPLDDRTVRQGLSRLVDRDALGKTLGSVYRDESPAGSTIPPSWKQEMLQQEASVILLSGPFVSSSPYYNRTVPIPTVDFEQAAKLLGGSGKLKRSGDFYYYNGRPWTLEMVVDKGLPDGELIAGRIAQDFRDAGVKVNYRVLDAGEWETQVDIRNGATGERFDLILARWSFDFQDEIAPIFRTGGKLNWNYYSSPEVDAKLAAFTKEGDFQRRVAIMKEVHKMLAEDAPYVFLWETNLIAAFSPEVINFRVHSFSFYVNPHTWDLRSMPQ